MHSDDTIRRRVLVHQRRHLQLGRPLRVLLLVVDDHERLVAWLEEVLLPSLSVLASAERDPDARGVLALLHNREDGLPFICPCKGSAVQVS